jgi:MFS family permease
MKKYFLEIIVFIGGAAVMVFEIVGARVLAPFMGTSIFIWSALIGVILAFLSAGYWWGGRVADKKPNYQSFSFIIFLAAVFIGLTGIFKLPVLNFLQSAVKDIRFGAVLASVILFGPASFLLAMISPYAARLKMTDLNRSGETVGRLYAVSTIGSILGTFLTGLVLVLYLGNTKIIFLLSALVLIASLLAYSKKYVTAKVVLILLAFVGLGFAGKVDGFFCLPVSFISTANTPTL